MLRTIQSDRPVAHLSTNGGQEIGLATLVSNQSQLELLAGWAPMGRHWALCACLGT